MNTSLDSLVAKSSEADFVPVDQMILDNGIVDNPEEVGFYTGFIESLFQVTGFLAGTSHHPQVLQMRELILPQCFLYLGSRIVTDANLLL